MENVSMTIRADNVYRTYATGQDPATLFKKATSYMDSAKATSRNEEQEQTLNTQLEDLMLHAIFGSNRIESAGLNLDITVHLCRKILRGEDVGEITERTPEYLQKLAELYCMDPLLKEKSVKLVLRGRQEIIQHVKAFQHMIHHFAVNKEDMTEELIKETHAILCKGVPVIHREGPETPSKDYAGKYRKVIVGAGNSNFVVPQRVPAQMAKLCADLKQDIFKAEADKYVDPFSLASKYSLEFVQIHPFLDGNGRMCRMILNVILFRFTGIFVAIGERESDREEYMGIKRRSSATMEGHGEYATFVLDKGMRSFRKLKQKLHGKRG
ncbi:Filamentation induced protein by cAMP/death on curing [Cordyceps fumosorosea ARSEF 2679]|uniref:Filamentation induced protein by cAMP/death on curing n=1 Tax=Cordyceps fumosorosea (strain ARSEF 2679) TaxID=1081104 RepID=A0A167TIR8_CORFA|nr:Filamentation induced protein by cAMP/death on curing [Cordyceps fumosorosea ARSEF 2679]OAA60639.1 Filamentation induced protein by cAMP/death on curing [Cordyceps fumosorosea ARSEF 2679]